MRCDARRYEVGEREGQRSFLPIENEFYKVVVYSGYITEMGEQKPNAV